MRKYLHASLLALGFIFVTVNCLLAADETHQVDGKSNSVTKNDALDYNDAEATAAQSITVQGNNIVIKSKVFTPPTGKTFVKFTATITYVDITANPDGLPIVRVKDTSSQIQVQSTFVAATAGNFPFSAEGNLGGGGGSGGPGTHWSAKIANLKFDLIVHDAFAGDGVGASKSDGPEISEENEESRGAFGVANLNDSDSDGTADSPTDNSITGEKDMIKVIIKKVTDASMSGSVTLTITGDGSSVKLWKSENKTAGEETTRSWSIGSTNWPVTFWVEGLQKSSSVRNIEVVLKKGVDELDKAKLTFVWATQTAVEHDRKTAAQLLAAADWINMTTPPKNYFTGSPPPRDGTGLLPNPVANPAIRNVIAMKYKLEPTGLWSEGIRWDITRHKESKTWGGTKQGGSIQWDPPTTSSFPSNDETANDDQRDLDESSAPNAAYEMFVEDSPAVISTGPYDYVLYRGNFREFVRVRLDAIKPSGGSAASPVQNGSRASARYLWHCRHRVENVLGTLVRDSGDSPETNTNDIAPGHITIGNPQ